MDGHLAKPIEVARLFEIVALYCGGDVSSVPKLEIASLDATLNRAPGARQI